MRVFIKTEMVARGGMGAGASAELRHADFPSRVGSPEALYFKGLPGRPLLSLHDNAQLIHAILTHRICRLNDPILTD